MYSNLLTKPSTSPRKIVSAGRQASPTPVVFFGFREIFIATDELATFATCFTTID
jgi:hypothetical protein